jgi:hypothetical protein
MLGCCRSPLPGCCQSSLCVVVVVIVSFSWPEGVVRGWPCGRSSESLLRCPLPLLLMGVGPVAPLTAVNRDVADSAGGVSKDIGVSCASAVVMLPDCSGDSEGLERKLLSRRVSSLWRSSLGRKDERVSLGATNSEACEEKRAVPFKIC